MPQITSSFILRSKSPNFERDSFKTIAEMAVVPSTWMNEGHISYCEEDGQLYIFSTVGYDEDGEKMTPEKLASLQESGDVAENGELKGMARWTKLPISPNFTVEDLRMNTLKDIDELKSIDTSEDLKITSGTIFYVKSEDKYYYYAKDDTKGDGDQTISFINEGSSEEGYGWFRPLISQDLLTKDVLDSTLETELANYTKTSDLETTLADYTKTSDLETTLADYAKTSDLETTLADYTKTSDLETTLADYTKTDDLENVLVEKEFLKKSDLDDCVSSEDFNTKMSELVELIEQAKQEGRRSALQFMYENVGAIYNDSDNDIEYAETPWAGDAEGTMIIHKAKSYLLNNVGDLTEQDMAIIYNAGYPETNSNNPFNKFAGRAGDIAIRTTLPAWVGTEENFGPISLENSFTGCDVLKVVYFCNGPKGIENYKVICNNLINSFSGCSKLIAIPQTIDVSNITDPELMKDAFAGCEELVYVNLEGLSVDVDMSGCKKLSMNSLAQIIHDANIGESNINITISEEVMNVVNGTNSIQEALDEMGGKVVLKLPNE